MPHLNVNGARLYYEEHGAGEETVVFAHGLLLSSRMFDAQIAALKHDRRCIAFDFRGQGRSAVTETGYDMDTLTADAVGLIEALGAAPCHFVGLSMGGFVGLRLGARHGHLLRSLTLLETSADPEPCVGVPKYRRFNFVARWFGLRLVAGKVMPLLFGRTFLNDPGRVDERETWRRRILANDRLGITRAAEGVIDREGVYNEIDRIEVPTLILVGEEDVATVPEKSERMHARIVASRLVVLSEAGHTSTVEQPEAVTAALADFLGASVAPERTRTEPPRGIEPRSC